MPRRGKGNPRGKGRGRGKGGRRPRPGGGKRGRGSSHASPTPEDESGPKRRVLHPMAQPKDEPQPKEEPQPEEADADQPAASDTPWEAPAPVAGSEPASEVERGAPPWEHPDWYDLHDDAWTAGIEREAEHYAELVLALPPLDAHDHLVDVGCGTGKAAAKIARAYPSLGRVSLLEPSVAKLERAEARVREALPQAVIQSLSAGIGEGTRGLPSAATLVVATSVLMPTMEYLGGSFADGVDWVLAALADLHAMLDPGGLLYTLETLPPPWTVGGVDGPVRRLAFGEFEAALEEAGFVDVQCVYRFRDRVVFSALKEAP